jgi:hypothetical protein
VRVGDRFTYDTKDEITGDPKGTYVAVVTEVSEKEIVTSVSFPKWVSLKKTSV